ncbi:MAG TPA: hypothetical protein VGK22_04470 [Candidatus Angelobacter sp.]|jgi:hypothetical protein
MLNFGKAARLILAIIPAFAMAQSPLATPATAEQKTVAVAPISAGMNSQVSTPATNSVVSDGSVQEPTATVEYVRGQLSVISHGAPLGQVLKLIAAKTRATVGVSPELQNEPVAAQLGPGSVREVITKLLDSPRIDYILLGTGQDSDSVQRIVVQSRRSMGRGTMAEIRPPQPVQDEESQLDENGKMPNGLTPAEARMTQDELREQWKKVRAEKLEAEILQQKQDREREKLEGESPQPQNPQPQDTAPQQ